jgi:hypothetical protein
VKLSLASAAAAALLFATPLAFAQSATTMTPPATPPAATVPATPAATAMPGTAPDKMGAPTTATPADPGAMTAPAATAGGCKTKKKAGSACSCKSAPNTMGVAKKDEGAAHTMCVVGG